ncbi:MAG: class I SAM-dependent DNA methyltransferase [Alcanivoracaceae bacterium]|nr:class I SAM-dependent DNA methyltransferase [Alcanivoracaceae bacterium]
MNVAQIEANLKKLIASFSKESFIFDLLLAYGLPKASITRLKKGNLNLSKVAGEVSWKKKLYFKEEYEEDLHLSVLSLKNELKQDQRFVIVTDYKTFLAIDTKTGDKLDVALVDLPKHYDFFLPWAGMEKSQHQNENPADVKAAVNMAKLFDAIKKDNPDDSAEFTHGLNVFLSRLLFCFFAEDTHIFEDNQFTNAVDSHTQADGSDLHDYLNTLFDVLNTPEDKRHNLPAYLNDFPYVNGGLFKDKLPAPAFTRASRAAMLSSGDQNWSSINPDIFGSMFQAVISTDQRGTLGQHYTSVPNIMKVIEPLFLNDLHQAFDESKGNKKKLTALLTRLSNIKIFDPACGSGNFLIIAYKELRKLEMVIIKEFQMLNFSNIHLSNFYGIEIDDFAHEIAKLALWLAEHQMNVEFHNEFGRTNPTLPLKDAGQIVHGNAARLDWEVVCPVAKESEVYILGNPPYIGSKNQDKSHKEDIKKSFSKLKVPGILDYVSCWFIKASNYMLDFDNVRCAFVSTSSITQGEQVAAIWPHVLRDGIGIFFAVLPFTWTNSAKGNAGVHCVIIGFGKHVSNKFIFKGNIRKAARNISPYLIDGSSCIVNKRTKSLAGFPMMGIGNKPIDDGNYLFSDDEKRSFINNEPKSKDYFFRWYGGREFAGGLLRWCLLPQRIPKGELYAMPSVLNLIENVREFRLGSSSKPTIKLAETPDRFHVENFPKSNYMVVQKVSTGIREYLPVGLFQSDDIASDLLNVIGSSDLSVFGIISSKMHMVWMAAVGGRFRDGFRYSSSLCYNTFPFPQVSTQRKNEIMQCAFRILEEREKHSEKTLAELYDPDKMPDGLLESHHQNDLAIERCYRSKPFKSDEERLEYLFKLYEKMIKEEQDKDTLFAEKKKSRVKRS